MLEPSLRKEGNVEAGLKPGGLLLDAGELGAPRGSTNLFMVGAVAGALGEPPIELLQARAVETLGRKADHAAIRSAVAAGYEAQG